METYPRAAVERTMKLQELAKKITWEQAAEIFGISDRQMRRWKQRYEELGYDGLFASVAWGTPVPSGLGQRRIL